MICTVILSDSQCSDLCDYGADVNILHSSPHFTVFFFYTYVFTFYIPFLVNWSQIHFWVSESKLYRFWYTCSQSAGLHFLHFHLEKTKKNKSIVLPKKWTSCHHSVTLMSFYDFLSSKTEWEIDKLYWSVFFMQLQWMFAAAFRLQNRCKSIIKVIIQYHIGFLKPYDLFDW